MVWIGQAGMVDCDTQEYSSYMPLKNVLEFIGTIIKNSINSIK